MKVVFASLFGYKEQIPLKLVFQSFSSKTRKHQLFDPGTRSAVCLRSCCSSPGWLWCIVAGLCHCPPRTSWHHPSPTRVNTTNTKFTLLKCTVSLIFLFIFHYIHKVLWLLSLSNNNIFITPKRNPVPFSEHSLPFSPPLIPIPRQPLTYFLSP